MTIHVKHGTVVCPGKQATEETEKQAKAVNERDKSYQCAAMKLVEIERFMTLQGLSAETHDYARICKVLDESIEWGFHEWFFSSVDPWDCQQPVLAVATSVASLFLQVHFHGVTGWSISVSDGKCFGPIGVDDPIAQHGLVALRNAVPELPIEFRNDETPIDEATAYKVMAYMVAEFKKKAGLT